MKKKTAADIIRDPFLAKKTHRQRVNYLNIPEVQRALAIENAEKRKPIEDESPVRKQARQRFEAMRNSALKSKPN